MKGLLEDLKCINIQSSEANILLSSVIKTNDVECFAYIVSVCQNPDFVDANYMIESLIEEAVEEDCVSIVNYAIQNTILSEEMIKRDNWYLVRISSGKVLNLFLDFIKTKQYKVDLNLYNNMFFRLCKNLDVESILLLKKYGYIDDNSYKELDLKDNSEGARFQDNSYKDYSHLLKKPKCPSHHVERCIRESYYFLECTVNVDMYNICIQNLANSDDMIRDFIERLNMEFSLDIKNI